MRLSDLKIIIGCTDWSRLCGSVSAMRIYGLANSVSCVDLLMYVLFVYNGVYIPVNSPKKLHQNHLDSTDLLLVLGKELSAQQHGYGIQNTD